MKKCLSVLLLSVMLFLMLPATGMAEGRALSYVSAENTLWLDTFEEGDVSGYYLDTGNNLREVVSDPDNTGNQVYHIKKDTYTNSKNLRWYGAEHNAIFTGYETTQFDARFHGADNYDWDYWEIKLRLDPYAEIGLVNVRTDANGQCFVALNDGGSWSIPADPFPENTWHTFSISMSQDNALWNFYLDGVLVAEDMAIANQDVKTRKFHGVYFSCSNQTVTGNEIWLDNVCGYWGLPGISGGAPTAIPTSAASAVPTAAPSAAPVTTPTPWTEDDLTVTFLGGSITEGTGANRLSTGYAAQVGEWFRTTYADKNVKIVNAGYGGTGSNFGMFRLKNQVLDESPDIIFVEFAVNDNDYGYDAARKYMEGIVRSALHAKKVPQIIFVYTTKYWNGFSNMKAAHQSVADYYNIPSIDVGAVVEERVANGANVYSLLGDGVHPTQTGHNLYAQTIIDALSAHPDEYFVFPTAKETPLISGNEVDMPRTVSLAENATLTGDWTISSYQDGSGAPATYMKTIESNTAGAEFTIDFYGKYLGLSYVMSNATGSLTYYIDGKRVAITNTNYGAINYEKGTAKIVRDNLSDGWHTLRMVVNGDGAVKLGDLLIDDGKAASSGVLLGDVSGDGQVNAKDVTLLRRAIAAGQTDEIQSAGDFSGDGQVNAKDVTLLRRAIAAGEV